jgi:RecA/RadA recombinase
MKDNHFLGLMKKLGQEGDQIPDTTGYIDTGSYIFNALLSSSIYGGIPNNRVTALGGEQGTYKSYFAMSAAKQFQEDNPEGGVIYYDTEFATDQTMLANRGIDTERMLIQYPSTLQDLRGKILGFITEYEKETHRPPLMIILDSLGNLPSAKELADATEGKDVRDMTRTQIIRSIFRTITLKLGILNIPMIVTNHTYAVIGAYVPTRIMSGGGGLQYAASNIVTLSKKRDKNGTEVIGNFVTAKMDKSRFSREGRAVTLRANFDGGLERYFGLLPLAEKYNIFKRVGNRYEMPDGSKRWEKELASEPEKYYTKEILDRLDQVAKREFALGSREMGDLEVSPIELNVPGVEPTEPELLQETSEE